MINYDFNIQWAWLWGFVALCVTALIITGMWLSIPSGDAVRIARIEACEQAKHVTNCLIAISR